MAKRTIGITLLCALLLSLGACNKDNLVSPPLPQPQVTILSVTPNVLSLGAKLDPVEIMGTGFLPALSVDMGAGTSIVSTEVKDSQHIEVVVTVSATATPGPRSIIVIVGPTTAQLDSALTISSNPAPVVRFEINPTSGTTSTIFQFDASDSTDNGSVSDYKWDFGDGEVRHGVTVKHEFQAKDTYTIHLTLTDNKNGISGAEKSLAVADNEPPIASFTVTPKSGTESTVFFFDASASMDPDGKIKSYHWVFGDGMADGVQVKHQFKKAGNYQVELHVTDSKDVEDVARKTISISFFDKDQAIKEIINVIEDFLRRFGNKEKLSAQEIVVGFSKSANCPGREKEINIIEKAQQEDTSSGVKILDTKVTYVDEHTARAENKSRFFGTKTDGSTFDGIDTHHFRLVNESGDWKICDFTVESGS